MYCLPPPQYPRWNPALLFRSFLCFFLWGGVQFLCESVIRPILPRIFFWHDTHYASIDTTLILYGREPLKSSARPTWRNQTKHDQTTEFSRSSRKHFFFIEMQTFQHLLLQFFQIPLIIYYHHAPLNFFFFFYFVEGFLSLHLIHYWQINWQTAFNIFSVYTSRNWRLILEIKLQLVYSIFQHSLRGSFQ